MSEPPPPLPGLSEYIDKAMQQAAETAHVHQWIILGVWSPPARPIHPLSQQVPYTVVLVKCNKCGLPETTSLDGVWTEEQVRGKASENG